MARQLWECRAGRWTYFLCCAVLSTYLSFFSFKGLLFRYASDAVILACTALELLLAEGLRAVSSDFVAAYGILCYGSCSDSNTFKTLQIIILSELLDFDTL